MVIGINIEYPLTRSRILNPNRILKIKPMNINAIQIMARIYFSLSSFPLYVGFKSKTINDKDSINPNYESIPIRTSVKKNKKSHIQGKGNNASAAGYVIKTKSGPFKGKF